MPSNNSQIQLLTMVYQTLLEIRSMAKYSSSIAGGESNQLKEELDEIFLLADTVHNIPDLLARSEAFDTDYFVKYFISNFKLKIRPNRLHVGQRIFGELWNSSGGGEDAQ